MCTDDAAIDDDPYKDPGAWRIAKQRLETKWTADIMKRNPRWLSFKHARQWSRAMWFTTEEDWMDWISAGEKRNPYIPSRPDEAYRDQWISWTDFLNGPIEE